ncbi:MAG: hypothetical protein ACR2IV_15750 [Bryobacteraceae bacterium]
MHRTEVFTVTPKRGNSLEGILLLLLATFLLVIALGKGCSMLPQHLH